MHPWPYELTANSFWNTRLGGFSGPFASYRDSILVYYSAEEWY